MDVVRTALVVIATLVSAVGLHAAGERNAPALLPPSIVSEGQRLGLTTRVPDEITTYCRRAARTISLQHRHWVVYCPPLVPRGGWEEVYEGGILSNSMADGWGITVLSPKLPNADGSDGHWDFQAGSAAALNLFVEPPHAPLSRIEHTQIASLPASIYFVVPFDQQGGEFGGHVVVQWKQRGVVYQMSLHGYQNLARAKLMATAVAFEISACNRRLRPAACAAFVTRPG